MCPSSPVPAGLARPWEPSSSDTYPDSLPSSLLLPSSPQSDSSPPTSSNSSDSGAKSASFFSSENWPSRESASPSCDDQALFMILQPPCLLLALELEAVVPGMGTMADRDRDWMVGHEAVSTAMSLGVSGSARRWPTAAKSRALRVLSCERCERLRMAGGVDRRAGPTATDSSVRRVSVPRATMNVLSSTRMVASRSDTSCCA
mmetsp:Transcript_35234/g.89180  ORF Transcript_35234/g.89180 Transcript_35234/m.89180 type:complete len:203 (-) Transcript_35234:1458-2066(-)